MKKAFSLMEVIIAVSILSVVMVTLLQVKSDNIFLLSKSNEKSQLRDYVNISSSLNSTSKRNENLFLDKTYSFKNDELRRELKDVKVKIKDEEVESVLYKTKTNSFTINTFRTSYTINDDIKKYIYTFKIGLN